MLSEYRPVWMIAMFDLPVATKRQRRAATQFRQFLLRQGFQMLQFSVYARYLDSADAADEHASRIRLMLPREGEVRILSITDRQFGKMQVFSGKKRLPPEPPPEQLMLF